MTTPVIEATSPQPRSNYPPMTYEEFLAYAFPEGVRVEWVRGEVTEMGSISDAHDALTTFLLRILSAFIDEHGLGRLYHEPFNMRLSGGPTGRCPDLMFLATGNFGRRRGTYLEGPADLAIEVVSPGSAAIDRGEKFYEYEAGGVTEYWIIDPQRQSAEFYQLDERGVYRPVLPGDGVYESAALPGLRLPVAWLWEVPKVAEAERALGIRD